MKLFTRQKQLSEPAIDPALAKFLANAYREEAKTTPLSRCIHCGGYHIISCPRVKSIEFNGKEPKRVEYWNWSEWPNELVLWPEDILAAEEES